MPLHRIKITQVFRVERVIEVYVNAENSDDAAEMVDNGTVDTPAFEDSRWRASWDLQNEEVAKCAS